MSPRWGVLVIKLQGNTLEEQVSYFFALQIIECSLGYWKPILHFVFLRLPQYHDGFNILHVKFCVYFFYVN